MLHKAANKRSCIQVSIFHDCYHYYGYYNCCCYTLYRTLWCTLCCCCVFKSNFEMNFVKVATMMDIAIMAIIALRNLSGQQAASVLSLSQFALSADLNMSRSRLPTIVQLFICCVMPYHRRRSYWISQLLYNNSCWDVAVIKSRDCIPIADDKMHACNPFVLFVRLLSARWQIYCAQNSTQLFYDLRICKKCEANKMNKKKGCQKWITCIHQQLCTFGPFSICYTCHCHCCCELNENMMMAIIIGLFIFVDR